MTLWQTLEPGSREVPKQVFDVSWTYLKLVEFFVDGWSIVTLFKGCSENNQQSPFPYYREIQTFNCFGAIFGHALIFHSFVHVDNNSLNKSKNLS